MINKRYLIKSISWRIVGTIDTFILSFFFSSSISFGLKISVIDFLVKLIFYYLHEKIWDNVNNKFLNVKLLYKTISWRVLGSSITIIVSYIILNNPVIGFKIGIFEILSKMALYFLHEKVWLNVKYIK